RRATSRSATATPGRSETLRTRGAKTSLSFRPSQVHGVGEAGVAVSKCRPVLHRHDCFLVVPCNDPTRRTLERGEGVGKCSIAIRLVVVGAHWLHTCRLRHDFRPKARVLDDALPQHPTRS